MHLQLLPQQAHAATLAASKAPTPTPTAPTTATAPTPTSTTPLGLAAGILCIVGGGVADVPTAHGRECAAIQRYGGSPKVPRVLIRETTPAQWGLREWEQRGGRHQQAATLAVHSRYTHATCTLHSRDSHASLMLHSQSTHATCTLHSRDTHAQGHPGRKQHCHSL